MLYSVKMARITSKNEVKRKMSNPATLKPFKKGEQRAKDAGSKGGIASAEVRRNRKQMKENLGDLLTLTQKKGACVNTDEVLSIAELKGKNVTIQDAILIAQINNALLGDVRSATFIRDTIGENPANKIDAKVEVNTGQLDNILEQLKAED